MNLAQLQAAIRREGGLNRRVFLEYAAGISAIPFLNRTAGANSATPKFPSEPFTVGVASGDPTPSGVVLWTRLAPRPLEPGGGMEAHNIEVSWELAEDETMKKVLRHGTATATTQLAHSVHVEVDKLEPNRWYWYRFRCGDAESRIARTRTLPTLESTPAQMQFAFASCQHYESGLYTAYEHMAKDELDFVFHLGDYIYEGSPRENEVRKHASPKCVTLDNYRIRHAQYKTDPLLQGMHARCPWFVTPDDHEVANDYANDRADGEPDPAKFLARRANAYQAYYEMMPLRHTSLPRGPKMQLYRQAAFGRLANFLVLDGRQYRSHQPNDDKPGDITDEMLSPKQSMLGKRQLGWVQDSLVRSDATWNVLAQQVMMCIADRKPGPERRFAVDTWGGYIAERNKLMEFVRDRKVANPVVITGDIHSNWVNELRTDDLNPESPIAAVEFVGTSISSGGNGEQGTQIEKHLMAENPGVKFFNAERGYVRCTLSAKEWRSDYVTVPNVSKPGGEAVVRGTFVVEAGKPGVQKA